MPANNEWHVALMCVKRPSLYLTEFVYLIPVTMVKKHPQDITMVIRYKDVPTDIVKASSLSQQNKDHHNSIKCMDV